MTWADGLVCHVLKPTITKQTKIMTTLTQDYAIKLRVRH